MRPAFPLPRTARLAVFASGRGSNLAALLRAFPPAPGPDADDADGDGAERPDPVGRVVLAFGNVPDAPALRRATEAGAAAEARTWSRAHGDRDAFERAAQHALDRHGVDLIVLAGFMRVLSPAFVRRWEDRIVNVHPSLLPAHRGLRAPEQAIRAGATRSGCTVHLVDDGVDTGRILAQRAVPVLPDDDAERLAARIQVEEHALLPATVAAWLRGAAAEGPLAPPAKEES